MASMRYAIAIVCLSAMPALGLLAQTKAPKAVKRATPTARNSDIFFSDAFKEALVGERPAELGKADASQAAAVATDSSGSAAAAGSGSASPGTGWSALISAQTLEDTIKSLKLQIDKELTTLSDFKGKGHKLARRDYTMLATLFAIASEYDGSVRWKKDAPAARDAFARSAASFKVATDQAFNEAKSRKEELSELVGGSSPFAGKPAEPRTQWGQVAARAPLMQYLESAWDPRLKPSISDKGQFMSGGDKALRDAEIFAAIGEVLSKDGMPDADAAEYKELSQKFRDGARQIIEAVKQKNFDQAAKAGSIISRACTECHENYRS
jgi:hypothetical protein